MKCPRCNEDMDFEEIKNYHGTWFCSCELECPGSRIPCDAEYFTDSAAPVVCGWEEEIEYKEPPTDEDLKDMKGDEKYHSMVDEGII